MLLSNPYSSLSVKFWIILRRLVSEIVQNAFLTQKHQFSQKLNFSLKEQVLIELRSCIHIIIIFSSWEVIVLLLDGKVMTFVLYPLIKFQEIVKDWNLKDSFAFEGVINGK